VNSFQLEGAVDDSTRSMIEDAYLETVEESFERGLSPLKAHMEGIVAAAMLLSAMGGVEDEEARKQVMDLGLRPPTDED
jgi:phosphoribosyl-dephospho-CoA transferase|tara:strand:+ start:1375 stop:1611 length:237 start_codon:yes stop_codon:yes gene_type:complete